MAVLRSDVVATLSRCDPEALELILEAAKVSPRGAESAQQLAERITDALWWHYSTPVGYLSERSTLEDIVVYVGRKVGVSVGTGDAWELLHQLTHGLLQSVPERGVAWSDLDARTQQRVHPTWIPTVGLGVGSGGSFGTAWASGKALTFLRGPVGRLLPYIPPIAPYYRAVVGGLGAVRMVAWPLGLALAVLSANEALGSNERKLVPLLLGIGGLGPVPVEDAFEVESPEPVLSV